MRRPCPSCVFGTKHVSGVIGFADDVPSIHNIPYFYIRFHQVTIDSGVFYPSLCVFDPHVGAIACRVASYDCYRADLSRFDGRAGGNAPIDPTIVICPSVDFASVLVLKTLVRWRLGFRL